MTTFSDAQRTEAERFWREYQQEYDLADSHGQIAGIDPETGKVWIGDWFDDVLAQRDAEGIDHPLIFERIGYPTVLKKLLNRISRD